MDERDRLVAAREVKRNPPVRAELVQTPHAYLRSSAPAHISGRGDEPVKTKPLLEMADNGKALLTYRPMNSRPCGVMRQQTAPWRRTGVFARWKRHWVACFTGRRQGERRGIRGNDYGVPGITIQPVYTRTGDGGKSRKCLMRKYIKCLTRRHGKFLYRESSSVVASLYRPYNQRSPHENSEQGEPTISPAGCLLQTTRSHPVG